MHHISICGLKMTDNVCKFSFRYKNNVSEFGLARKNVHSCRPINSKCRTYLTRGNIFDYITTRAHILSDY